MQTLFISDIHGIIDHLDKIDVYLKSSDLIVILGDIFYAGANRNSNHNYDPKHLKRVLNVYKNKIIAVEGNMDGYEEGVELLESRMIDGHKMYFTHGHYYHSSDLNIKPGDIFITGHSHVPQIKKEAGIYYLNPGSLSLPRNEIASFMVYQNNQFTIYDINHQIIDFLNL